MNTATAEMTEETLPSPAEAKALAAHNGRKSSRDQVYDAILELSDSETPAKAQDISRVTGLAMPIVYDSIKALKQRGRIYSDNGTFFVCGEYQPAQPVYHTAMPDGIIKLEKGDQILTLNPREARALAKTMGGVLEQAATIVMSYRQDEQHAQIRRLKRQIERLEESLERATGLSEQVAQELRALRGELGG